MTNFNPMTALETYENNNFDGMPYISQNLPMSVHGGSIVSSQLPSHISTQR